MKKTKLTTSVVVAISNKISYNLSSAHLQANGRYTKWLVVPLYRKAKWNKPNKRSTQGTGGFKARREPSRCSTKREAH